MHVAGVRGVATFVLGLLVGLWLAFGATGAPPERAGVRHAWRGADALETLALESAPAARVRVGGVAGEPSVETTVPLEQALGVWMTRVVLNGARAARFLVDTGSSVTVVSPRLATDLGLPVGGGGPSVELHTLGGRIAGPSAVLASLRVGDLEERDAPVVLHDPGAGLDGILGNAFLGRYRVTLDATRRQLQLRRLAHD